MQNDTFSAMSSHFLVNEKCSGCLPHSLPQKWVLTDFTESLSLRKFHANSYCTQLHTIPCNYDAVSLHFYHQRKWTFNYFTIRSTIDIYNEAFVMFIEHCTLDSIRYLLTKYDEIVVIQRESKVKRVKS